MSHHSYPRTHANSSSSSTTQACAACKYQRRKCAPDCILAPYFPHDRQRQFLNAHKLFGVSNITKIIKNLNREEKDEAMRTIMYQSDVRAVDPVGGCLRIINDLQRQIEYNKAELDIVLHQLAIIKAQEQQQQQQQQQRHDAGELLLLDDPIMSGYNHDHNSNVGILHQHQFMQPYDEAAAFVDQNLDQEDVGMWGLQDAVSISMSSSSSMHLRQGGSVNDFDDIKLERNDHHLHHHHYHQNLNFELCLVSQIVIL